VARTKMMCVIVTGFLLGASVATAQTAGSPARSTLPSIVPVTGPSTVASLPEPVKPESAPAVAAGEVNTTESVSKAAAGHPAPRTTKVVRMPGAKSTVKKTSTTTKHVAKAAGSTKAKHVAATKQKSHVHHAMVGKPTPVTKHQAVIPSAKGAAPGQPVLPRV
jgi:hypothetical protein